MEAKWLEDFIALADTRSFSRAAELRHITQPAFSRRIQALEAWVGTDLVDRTVYPTRLTAAGETFRGEAAAMLAHLEETRALLRNMRPPLRHAIDIAVPHTLSLTFFPNWLAELSGHPDAPRFATRLSALNVHDAAMSLVHGNCDLAMVYHHPRLPVELDPRRFDMLVLGTETVRPYARCNAQGGPEHTLRGDGPVPYLAYAPNAYLGRIAGRILASIAPPPVLDVRHETDMAEGLKVMVLAGHGLAFLPESAARGDEQAGRLARVDDDLCDTLEIRLYRERPGPGAERAPAPGGEDNAQLVDALWRFLAARTGAA